MLRGRLLQQRPPSKEKERALRALPINATVGNNPELLRTALHEAAERGHPEDTARLLRAGASCSLRDAASGTLSKWLLWPAPQASSTLSKWLLWPAPQTSGGLLLTVIAEHRRQAIGTL